ncbi:bifunctional regulator KidO [Caulobacter mirabilis]|uniref:Bifunctional regulator KidO n=1 Tax=Caulobacter mirabilis TaxID=69666 RepID=A0A2D2ASY9_9CAUL|nr:bifunctional regulator KidO [Caulobacter mirabilis]ATQ41106.1 bifunctional regulator KidO [Caulobacter mirabilis]
MNPLLSKLGLGSSQFVPGGSSQARGRPPEVEVREVLTIAARAGLGVFDVSGAHGRSEVLLGEMMPRPVPFRLTLNAARPDRGPDFVEAEARASLARIAVEGADAIVAPLAADLFSPHGPAMWDRLLRLRDSGLVKKIGIALHATDDPVGVVKRFKPDLIQAPASLLDQRMLADGTLERIAGMGVEVQMRSIFLNGLLFLPLDRLPNNLKGASRGLSRARRLIAEGRSDPLQAALGFALSRPEASAVLVNVAGAAELSAVIAAASSPPPDLDWDEMAIDDPTALDPHRWAAA